MAYTVYKHASPSGKVYIGITSRDVKERWGYGQGYRNNEHFWRAIQKYGWKNFEHKILHENLTKEEACEKEKELIAFYKSTNSEYGYNHSIGGESGSNGIKHSPETIEKIRNSNIGKKRSAETRERVRKAKTGVKYSEEASRKKSIALKGRKFSDETKEKIGRSNGKPVVCIETGEVFYSAVEASRQMGLSKCAVWYAVKNGQKSKGFHWKYLEDAENEIGRASCRERV